MPLALFLWEFHEPEPPVDDAYISFRYALNLVEGHGLVFNAGERVEGYTNLSWTLAIALGLGAGFDATAISRLLGLASGALLLLSTQGYAARLLPVGSRWLAATAPLALLASNGFASWTLSGLETPLFASLVTLALVAHAGARMGWACACCVLASLTRPEGVLVAALVLGSDWLRRLARQRPAGIRRLLALSAPVLVFVAYLTAHTLWRLVYYGDVVPNTFHAKVGGIPIERGVGYVRGFLVDGAAFLLPAAVVGCVLVKEARLAVALVVGMALYAIAVGGDVFRFGRFLLPVLPALLAAAVVGSHASFARSRGRGLLLGLGIPGFALSSLYLVWPSSPDLVSLELRQGPTLVSAKRTLARTHPGFGDKGAITTRTERIRRLRPPVRTLGSIAIGEVGYRLPEVAILDLVGLTDRHIARSPRRVENAQVLPGHHRTDADYVLDRRPDVLWIPRAGSASPLALPCVLELWRHPRFGREYFWDDRLELYRRRPEAVVPRRE